MRVFERLRERIRTQTSGNEAGEEGGRERRIEVETDRRQLNGAGRTQE